MHIDERLNAFLQCVPLSSQFTVWWLHWR